MSQEVAKLKFDVVVMGGGITGVGAALALARAKRKVAIVEQDSLLSQTSANSLRIIHGGFRYLQTLNIPRVLDSAWCQHTLLRDYGHWIKPLPCVMPLQARGMKSAPFARMGLLAYGALHCLKTGKFKYGKILSREYVEKNIQLLRGKAPHGALYWEDAHIVDQESFHSHLKDELLESGVALFEKQEVIEQKRSMGGYVIETKRDEEVGSISARVLVNALGPQISSLKPPVTVLSPAKPSGWCLGFNMIFDREEENQYGIGIQSQMGRLFFVAPRAKKLAIGTWYIPWNENKEKLNLESTEVLSALAEIKVALPSLALRKEELCSLEQGVLPSGGMKNGEPYPLGKQVIRDVRGYIEVLSTKYTTFLSSGKKVSKVASRYFGG